MLLPEYLRFSARPTSLLLLAVFSLFAGCRPTTANRLLGEWVGVPDTAEARAEREERRYGKSRTSVSTVAGDSQPADVNRPVTTDWEQFDVAMRFHFVDLQRLEMSLADGSQPITAEWSVLELTPTGAVIEVFTVNDHAPGEPVRRRFELEFDQHDGNLYGFLMTEVGTDPQLGAIYFQPKRP